MHTGSTAVFGQSNLACDLPCAGPPTFSAARAVPLSALRRPPESLEDVCGVQRQSVSRTFQLHQVSDEGGLRFPGGAAPLRNKSDATPNV